MILWPMKKCRVWADIKVSECDFLLGGEGAGVGVVVEAFPGDICLIVQLLP